MLDYSKWDALSESGASSCSDVEEAKLDGTYDLGAVEVATGCDWTQAWLAPILPRRLLKGRQEKELLALALELCRCGCQPHSQAAFFTIGREAAPLKSLIDRWAFGASLQQRTQDDGGASVGRLVEAEGAEEQLAEAREALQRALGAERRRAQQATVFAAALRRAQCRRQEAYERSAEALRQAQEERELLQGRMLEETRFAWDEVERQHEEYAALARAFQDKDNALKLSGDEVRAAREEVDRLTCKHEETLNMNAALMGKVREQEEALEGARRRQCDMEQMLHSDVTAVSQKMASFNQERDALQKSLENKEQALQDARRKCQETIAQLHREREEVNAWAQEVNKQAQRQAAERSQQELLQKEQALQVARRESQELAAGLHREKEEARARVEEVYRTAHQEVLGIYGAQTQLRLSSKEEVLNSAHERQRELEKIWRHDIAQLSWVVESQRRQQGIIELDLEDREERLQAAYREREELQRRRCEEVRLAQEELERQKRSLKSLRERNKVLERALHALTRVEDVAEEDQGEREESATETEEATEVPAQHKMEEATDKRKKALAKAAKAAQRHVEAVHKRALDLEKSLERAQRDKRQAVRRVRRQQREEPAYLPCEEEMLCWKSRAEDARQRVERQKAQHNALLSKKDKALKVMQDERDEARRKKREELERAKKDKDAELQGASQQLRQSEEALAAKEASLRKCVKEKEELESRWQEEQANMQKSLKSCLREKEELKACVRQEQESLRKSREEKEELESRRLEERETTGQIHLELTRELEALQSEKEAADEEVAKLRSEREASLGAARQQQASALIGHTWQFQANDSTWIPFAPEQSDKMMQAFLQGQDIFTMVHDGATYEENLRDMVQTNHQTGKTRNIRCTFGLPQHWSMRDTDILQMLRQRLTGSAATSSVPSSTFGVLGTNLSFESVAQKITGKARLREFSNILRASVFHHSNESWASSECNRMKSKLVVTEAYHVENIHLLERYQANCKLLQSKHVQHGVEPASVTPDLPQVLLDFGQSVGVQPDVGSINERLLFHGTSWETAVQIAMEGFDSRLGKASGMYGKGTYFASQSCKSHQYSGHCQVKTILLARVALGDPYYTACCDKNVVRPPKKDSGEGPLCDSLIARPGWMRNHHSEYQTHMEFVIFEQMQAYPEFILRYRLLPGSAF